MLRLTGGHEGVQVLLVQLRRPGRVVGAPQQPRQVTRGRLQVTHAAEGGGGGVRMGSLYSSNIKGVEHSMVLCPSATTSRPLLSPHALPLTSAPALPHPSPAPPCPTPSPLRVLHQRKVHVLLQG